MTKEEMDNNERAMDEFYDALSPCDFSCMKCELATKIFGGKIKCKVNNKIIGQSSELSIWVYDASRPGSRKRDALIEKLKLEKLKHILS